MKKNYLFALAMAAAFASCSDDNDSVNVPENGEARGYMSFNVSLPSMSTTRAENDQFAEGEDAEYAVNDITICLLDDAGKILQVATPTTTWTDQGNQNVARVSATIEVKTTTAPKQALVVLNNKSNLTLAAEGSWTNSLLSSKTVADFITSNGTNNVASGITMTNAAIVVGNNVQDLTPITDDNLAATLTDAQNNPVEVYVERVVAKVSIDNSSKEFSTGLPAGVQKIELSNWALDVTNTATYPLRKTETSWVTTGYTASYATAAAKGNRMIGGESTTPRRVYWAIDANYSDENKTEGNYTYGFTTLTKVADVNRSLIDVDYCLENTFDVANQKQNQTTRVVFKTTITPSVEGYTSGNFFTLEGSSNIWTVDNLATQIKTYAVEAGVTVADELTKTGLTGAQAGTITLDAEFLKTLLGASEVTDDQVTAISTKLGKVYCYENGVAYYTARIKHFGDDLTPWSSTDPTYGSEIEASNNWLGRYGVVRNNWYELKVTGIKKLGTPTLPEITPDPDDEKEEYMVYKINILSWAKRSQNVEL